MKFFLRLSADNDCLNIIGSDGVGPWVVLGGNVYGATWSSVAYFKIRQRGV